MAEVTVRITRLLAEIAGATPEIVVQASTAAEALDAVCTEIPALRVHIFDDRGEFGATSASSSTAPLRAAERGSPKRWATAAKSP